MKQIYIIEHLEPRIWSWCLIEYKNIGKIVGKSNLWFTNINSRDKNVKELRRYGKIINKSVKNLDLQNSCVLDPEANKELGPKEAKGIRYFIFGGILGDYPPKKRTKKELTRFIKNSEQRNIGKKQFSTDNAVYVVHEIAKGIPLNKMKFQNKLTIQINEIESVELPYYYPLIKEKPKISKEIIKYLKDKKEF